MLNQSLVEFLVLHGYKYCLSKTTNIRQRNASVRITLTPIKTRPVTKHLPKGYDTYFNIIREPMQLAAGVDDTEVLIHLDDDVVRNYKGSVSII